MKTIKKFGLLVSVVMASAVLARAEQGKNSALNSLNEMAGSVIVEAPQNLTGVSVGEMVTAKECHAPPNTSYGKMSVNDDRSISIIDPFFMLGQERFSIDFRSSNGAGVCKLYGLGSFRFFHVIPLLREFKDDDVITIDEQGKARGLSKETVGYLRTVVCEAR